MEETIGMSDIKKKRAAIGSRIKEERKKRSWSQEEFGWRMKQILNPDSDVSIPQNTISGWENGKSLPEIYTFFAMAELFHCDVGYLLCEYDEPIHGTTDICKATGLSEHTVSFLCRMQSFGAGFFPEIRYVIDALVFDYEHDSRDNPHQPIFQLLYWFFRHSEKKSIGKAVTIDNRLENEIDFYIAHSINLDGIIESAVLAELQRALVSLKQLISHD